MIAHVGSPSLSRLSAHSRLLIAESDDTTLQSVIRSLEFNKLNLDVDVCTSCHAALQKLPHRPYGLVISSVSLAAINGFELVKRTQSRQTHMPLVLTTDSGGRQSALEALEHGAFDVITTPIKPEQVAATVRLGLWYKMLLATQAAREKAQEQYRRHMRAYPTDTKARLSFMQVVSSLHSSLSACRRSLHCIEMSSAYLNDLATVLSRQVREQALRRLAEIDK